MKHRFTKTAAMLLALTFVLGSYKGYLALWEDNDPDPKQIFPCPVSSLPQADQEALEKGIYIGSNNELSRLLEDYLS